MEELAFIKLISRIESLSFVRKHLPTVQTDSFDLTVSNSALYSNICTSFTFISIKSHFTSISVSNIFTFKSWWFSGKRILIEIPSF